MSSLRVNEQILSELNLKCKDDKIINKFLINLIYVELEKQGYWKDNYRNLIEEYSEIWVDENEN